MRGTLDDPIVAEYARPAEFLPVMRALDPGADLSRWDAALVSFTYGTRKLLWSSAAPAVVYDLAADPGEADPRPASDLRGSVASNRAADRAARRAARSGSV